MKKNLVAAAVIVLFASFGQIASAQTIDHIDSVRAHGTDTYRLVFSRGQNVRLAVIGDGDTDLDLYVYDENGNLVASDTDLTDDCLVSWTPRWTGVFTVRVVNRGGVYNRYRVVAI